MSNVQSNSSLKDRCIAEIDLSIEHKFDQKMSECPDLDSKLKELYKIIVDLKTVKECTAPCYPPEYKIEELYRTKYLEKVEKIVSTFIDTLKAEGNKGEYLIFASWLESYEQFLKSIGIAEEKNVKLKAEIKNTLPEFYDHLEKLFISWFNKLYESEIKEEEKLLVEQSASLNINFTISLFKQVNDQINIISQKILGNTLKDVIRLILGYLINILDKYVESSKMHLQAEKYVLHCQRLKNMCECYKQLANTKEFVSKLFKEENSEIVESICNEAIESIVIIRNRFSDS
jgi:hypothetical protein